MNLVDRQFFQGIDPFLVEQRTGLDNLFLPGAEGVESKDISQQGCGVEHMRGCPDLRFICS